MTKDIPLNVLHANAMGRLNALRVPTLDYGSSNEYEDASAYILSVARIVDDLAKAVHALGAEHSIYATDMVAHEVGVFDVVRDWVADDLKKWGEEARTQEPFCTVRTPVTVQSAGAYGFIPRVAAE